MTRKVIINIIHACSIWVVLLLWQFTWIIEVTKPSEIALHKCNWPDLTDGTLSSFMLKKNRIRCTDLTEIKLMCQDEN